MGARGERRKALSVRVDDDFRAALERRVAVVSRVAAREGLKAPTESDVARWLMDDARRRRPLDWMPQTHGLLALAGLRKRPPARPSEEQQAG